jgi:hypothetical protein
MPSVYDPDNFSGRVNYAAQCFMRGLRCTRHFDTCFEMADGDAVVAALVRRSAKNPKLRAAIASQYRDGFPQGWTNTAARLAHVPTRGLPVEARRQRAAFALRFNLAA